MGDYCKRSDTEQISLGFRPANPVNFDIKVMFLQDYEKTNSMDVQIEIHGITSPSSQKLARYK
ncbi:hypothetical protein A2U01_0037378, partial [Trifolium medium]|nr:hypothetical protein [Trifolium medium]